jgi:hypothetical protein
MKTTVFIPFSNTKVFKSMFRRDRYHKEFKEWMIETFGQVSGGMWGTQPNIIHNHLQTGMNFWFKEPSHAMMFKLTWA